MSMHFFRGDTHLDFVGRRRLGYFISGAVVLLGFLAVLMSGGLRYGVDFAGGAAVQLDFANPVDDEAIKNAFSGLRLPGLAVQQYGGDGHDYLVRFAPPADMTGEAIRTNLLSALAHAFGENEASISRLEMVGPKVGADLRNAAMEALYYAILLITVYISGRFEHRWMIAGIMAAALGTAMYAAGLVNLGMGPRVCVALVLTLVLCWKLQLNFALGAIVALIHDVVVTVGLLTFLGKEFDLNIIAALLTLVGYSLNDTIIIYDRIRENLGRQSVKDPQPLGEIINLSINQTLGRTIMTSFTTLLATVSLLVLGGGTIHDFALTMTIGVFVGTFSTVFVSAPILMAFGDTRHYMVAKQETYERPGEHGVV